MVVTSSFYSAKADKVWLHGGLRVALLTGWESCAMQNHQRCGKEKGTVRCKCVQRGRNHWSGSWIINRSLSNVVVHLGACLTGLRVIQTPSKNSISWYVCKSVSNQGWQLNQWNGYRKSAIIQNEQPPSIHWRLGQNNVAEEGGIILTFIHTRPPLSLLTSLPLSPSPPSQNRATVFFSFGVRTPGSLTSVPLTLN